jgi:hypothetical protein
MHRTPRRILALSAWLLATIVSTMPAMANNVPNVGVVVTRFIGVVNAIQGPAESPAQITLQLGTLTTDVRINLKTVFSGKSAEANVEGLLQGDYATVIARRFKGVWVAKRVIFDVQPMIPLHLFSGTVTKETLDGRHVTIRLVGTQRFIAFRIAVAAQFQSDGHAELNPLSLFRGATVELLALHSNTAWVAYTVNLKITPFRFNAHER